VTRFWLALCVPLLVAALFLGVARVAIWRAARERTEQPSLYDSASADVQLDDKPAPLVSSSSSSLNAASASDPAAMLSHAKGRIFFALNLVYLPLAQIAFHPFTCFTLSEAPNAPAFLQAALWLPCDSATRRHMLGAAVPAVILYVVGIPLYFFARVWRSLHRMRADAVLQSELGFLWMSVASHRWWFWELGVVGARKLLLASATSCLTNSVAVPLLATLTLLAALLLQVRFRPFHYASDNRLEAASLCTALVLYLAALLAAASSNRFGLRGLSDAVVYASLLAKLAAVLVATRQAFRKGARAARERILNLRRCGGGGVLSPRSGDPTPPGSPSPRERLLCGDAVQQ
jgi:hypothetical protein